jgi:hypothetical protein
MEKEDSEQFFRCFAAIEGILESMRERRLAKDGDCLPYELGIP